MADPNVVHYKISNLEQDFDSFLNEEIKRND